MFRIFGSYVFGRTNRYPLFTALRLFIATLAAINSIITALALLYATFLLFFWLFSPAHFLATMHVIMASLFGLLVLQLMLYVIRFAVQGYWRKVKRLVYPMFFIAVPLALVACSTTNPLQSVINTLSSPQATQAASNLKTITMSLTCTVANLSALESQIAPLITQGQAAIRDSQTACVVSTAVCDSLGGTAVAASCTAPAPGSVTPTTGN
jgi:hypothetical protein